MKITLFGWTLSASLESRCCCPTGWPVRMVLNYGIHEQHVRSCPRYEEAEAAFEAMRKQNRWEGR